MSLRNWITLMQGGRKIERPVYTDLKGCGYVRVHGKKLFLDRLQREGRIVSRYIMGTEEQQA